MADISEKLCEAVDIIVKSRLSKLSFDNTLECTIKECTDASIGEYKVIYQDSTFYAYAIGTINYTKGERVNVLIPQNNMNRKKVILGGVAKESSLDTMQVLVDNKVYTFVLGADTQDYIE